MLNKLITEIVDPLLTTLSPNWIDKYGGLVQTLEVKKVADINNLKKTHIQKYPISCNVDQTECNDPTSKYADLVPDESKASIVYWEELSPMQFVGNVSRGSQLYKNKQQWKGKGRLVVWLNAAKLGVGDGNGNYSCDWYFPFLDQLTQLLTTEGNKMGGAFDGGLYKIQPVKIVPKDLAVFNKYTYDRYTNFSRYPYDYFAIDFEFTMQYCVGKNSVIPSGAAIACPFNEGAPILSNTYSLSFDGNDEYAEAPADSSLSFGDGVNDGAFSISYWAFNSGGKTQWVLNKKASNTLPNMAEYQTGISVGNTVFFTLLDQSTIGASNYLEANTTSMIPLSTWVNVIVTYSGSKLYSGLNIYFDGVAQPTANTSVGSYTGMNETTAPLTIGKAGWISNLYYAGLLDEISIWRTEFTPLEVAELYNGGLPTILTAHSQAATLEFWNRCADGDFFDGTNWILADNSTNNNTLTTTNIEFGGRVANVPT